MATSPPNPRYLYKILPSTANLPVLPSASDFILPKTSLDIDSGFIHFSTSTQVPYVLTRFFSGPETSTVWLVKINYAELSSNGDVRWEKAGRDDSLFAHLYGGDVTGPMVCDAIRLSRNNGWDSRVQQLAEDEWLV